MFTNLTVTVEGGELLAAEAVPTQVAPQGSLVVFDCLFRQTPGATNATISIASPCLNMSSTYDYPELILLQASASAQRSAEVRLCWNSRTTSKYQVEFSTDLNAGTWESLGDPVAGNGQTNCVTDAMADPQRYYRVVTVP